MVPAFAWLLAALAGVTYASWVLQFVINPELDPVNGYVSELSASDQPYHDLFAAGDFVSGLLTIVVVALILRSVRPRGYALMGWLALVIFGAFSIADSLFAMDCAPNSDTMCALRERAEKVSFAHQFHSVTSACVVIAGIISLIALTIASRRERRWPVIARWSWILLVMETVAAAATLPLMYLGVLLGVVERVQVAILSIWLFVIAGQLYADRRSSPGPRRLRPLGRVSLQGRRWTSPGQGRLRAYRARPGQTGRAGPVGPTAPSGSTRPSGPPGPSVLPPPHAWGPGAARERPAPSPPGEPAVPPGRAVWAGPARPGRAAPRRGRRPDDGTWDEASRT
jgi:hypothetical protein